MCYLQVETGCPPLMLPDVDIFQDWHISTMSWWFCNDKLAPVLPSALQGQISSAVAAIVVPSVEHALAGPRWMAATHNEEFGQCHASVYLFGRFHHVCGGQRSLSLPIAWMWADPTMDREPLGIAADHQAFVRRLRGSGRKRRAPQCACVGSILRGFSVNVRSILINHAYFR